VFLRSAADMQSLWDAATELLTGIKQDSVAFLLGWCRALAWGCVGNAQPGAFF
jgi:hypothetical protein